MPIDEIADGIDRWVWPLQMPECALSPKVRKGCHAVALDDERNTFHPVLWDERHGNTSEARELLADAKVQGGRPDDYAVDILATLREPFLVLDRTLRVVSANRAFYATFEVNRDETEGRRIYELGNGQWDIPRLRHLLEDILPQNTNFEGFEVTHAFDTVGKKTMLLNARRIRKPGSHTDLILLAIEDITDRKAAAHTWAHLAAIVTSSDDAIISKDLNGVITSWNRGAQSLFGYSAEEAVGKPVTMLIPDDHLEEEPEILARIKRGEAVEHYETVRRRKDGSRVDISLTISPIRDGKGTIAGASKIARDISERVALQKRLAAQAEQIAERVAAQGRVPGHAQPRAAQPPRFHSLCGSPPALARARFGGPHCPAGPRDHRAPGRQPHQDRQRPHGSLARHQRPHPARPSGRGHEPNRPARNPDRPAAARPATSRIASLPFPGTGLGQGGPDAPRGSHHQPSQQRGQVHSRWRQD